MKQYFPSAVSNQFEIVTVLSPASIMGTFAGLPNNATFNPAPSRSFSINYFSGAGNNDIVLTQLSVPQPALITGIGKGQIGAMQISATGTPGVGYDVYATTNIASTNWVNLGTVTADGAGLMQFLDNDSLGLPMRFYHLVLP